MKRFLVLTSAVVIAALCVLPTIRIAVAQQKKEKSAELTSSAPVIAFSAMTSELPVGELYFDHKKNLWVFRGNADESARLFLERLNVRSSGDSAKCTEALLDALRRAKHWLPGGGAITSYNGQKAITVGAGTLTFSESPSQQLRSQALVQKVEAARLEQQADDLDQIDRILKECGSLVTRGSVALPKKN